MGSPKWGSVITPAHSYSYLVQAQSLLRLSDSYRHVSGQGSIPTEELADSGKTEQNKKNVCISQAATWVQCMFPLRKLALLLNRSLPAPLIGELSTKVCAIVAPRRLLLPLPAVPARAAWIVVHVKACLYLPSWLSDLAFLESFLSFIFPRRICLHRVSSGCGI